MTLDPLLPLLFLLALWVVLSLIVAAAAARKGRSGVGCFLLSLVATPLIGFVVVLMLSERPTATGAER